LSGPLSALRRLRAEPSSAGLMAGVHSLGNVEACLSGLSLAPGVRGGSRSCRDAAGR